jgi:hypothetical protein
MEGPEPKYVNFHPFLTDFENWHALCKLYSNQQQEGLMKISMINIEVTAESGVWIKSVIWGILTAVLMVTLLGLMSL